MANSTFFGYTSVIDFCHSFFGYKSIKLNLFIASLAGFHSAITGYIYDDHLAIYTLCILYGFDFITGVGAAWYTHTISSAKLPRILFNIIMMTLLISMSWWIAKGNQLFIYLPGIIIGGAYSTLFISLLENLSKLEVLPKGLQKVIQKRFGLSAVERRLFDDESPKSEKDNISEV